MSLIILLVVAIVGLVLLIIALFQLALYVCSVGPYGGLTPPFVPSSRKLAELIASTLDPQPDGVMYELGAGDMRISLAAWKRQPQARYIGIEKHAFPRMLAKFNIWKGGAEKQASAREADLYTTDLSNATHIYCYLFPEAMQKLHQKFSRELLPGAKVVSLDFPIKTKNLSTRSTSLRTN